MEGGDQPEEKNPGRTPEDEYEDRVEMTYRLLSEGMRKSEIKQALRSSYGVCARTAENYLARARELQLMDLREERDYHRGASLALYKRIISDPSSSPGVRLAAQRQIDSLLGLAVPMRVAMQIRDSGITPERNAFDEAIENATLEEIIAIRKKLSG